MSSRTLVACCTLVASIALSLAQAPRALAWDWLRSENGHVRDGNEALRAGDAQAAQAEYDRAAAELPSEPGVHLNRGLALLAQDQHDQAREAFLRATEPPAPREIRASAYYDTGLSFYREADAAATEGDHARARDLFGQAAEQFRQSLRQVPGNRDAAWNLELALRRETQEEEEQEREEQEQQQQQDQQQQDQQQQDQQQQDQQQQDQQQQDQQQQDQQQQDQQQQDQQQQDQQQQDQQQQDQQQQEGQEDGQDGQQDQAGQPGEQNQPQDQQPQDGESGQPGDQDPSDEEAAGTMERSLPPDQQRVLDALQDSEENLERARARARGQRERRRPTQDW
jgi:Ca-activated chloride channel family protein